MSGILAYALHYEGAFNKNSLGGVSEAARLAEQAGCVAHAVVSATSPMSSPPRWATTA